MTAGVVNCQSMGWWKRTYDEQSNNKRVDEVDTTADEILGAQLKSAAHYDGR